MREPKPLTLKQPTNTMGVKVYKEQCSGGFQNVLERVRKLPIETYESYAVIHYKDGKPHLHIALHLIGKKTERVFRILNLLGITFRKEDTGLMLNRGLETLGSFKAYLRYLTHTDEESIKANKKRYDLSEFVTNMDRTVFTSLLGDKIKEKKLSKKERLQHDCRDANIAGYDLWNYSQWLETKKFDFVDYSKNDKKKIKEFFREGQVKRYLDGLPQIIIFIYKPQSMNISINRIQNIAKNALNDLHIYENTITNIKKEDYYHLDNNIGLYSIVQIRLSEEINERTQSVLYTKLVNYEDSGDYRPVSYHIERGGRTYTIVLSDDQRCLNLLNIIENKVYYCCTINPETKKLVFIDADKRGSNKVQLARRDLYIRFRDAFNLRLQSFDADYSNNEQSPGQEVDYSDL